MSNKKNIIRIPFKKSDAYRSLLTDTLPYEVPVRFSNAGFYDRVKSGALERLKSEASFEFVKSGKDFTIPYDYSIKKDSLSYRTLSIPHPSVQLEYCELYRKYGQLILNLCSRSNFSLRRPARVATHFYEKRRATKFFEQNFQEVETTHNGFADQSRSASSYFAYDRYSLIHKFYESQEYHELEKKFTHLRTLDISKCFHHIYTHSFTWAAKSKEYGKEHRDESSFEQTFDKLMQRSNYNETNGIIVGPEVSRVFAEVILQSIDGFIKDDLEEAGISAGKDYEVRRYVDDYFIFFNDSRIADVCQKVLAKRLEQYKLYINDAKTATFSRPFLSGQTSAKIELAALIDRMFAKHTRTKSEIKHETSLDSAGNVLRKPFCIKYVGNPSTVASGYIRDVKTIVAKYQTAYEGVLSYFLTISIQRLANLISQVDLGTTTLKEVERLTRFIYFVLETIFFCYAMSPRVRATYQISSLCLFLNRFSEELPNDLREPLKNYLADEIKRILRNSPNNEDSDNIEVVNLLATLKTFGEEYLLTVAEILTSYNITVDSVGKIIFPKNRFGYFQIVTLLHYIEDLPDFSHLHTALIEHIISLYGPGLNQQRLQRNTALSMLAFDFLNCPFVNSTMKIKFSEEIARKFGKDDIRKRAAAFRTIANEGDWFYCWNKSADLREILWKKELRSAY